jgi:hypothetical protein
MRDVMFGTLIHELGLASSRIRRVLGLGGCALTAVCLLGCTNAPPPPPGYAPLSISVSGLLPNTSVDVHIDMLESTGYVILGLSSPETSGDIYVVEGTSQVGSVSAGAKFNAYVASYPSNDSCMVVSPVPGVNNTVTIGVYCTPNAATISGTVTGLQTGNQLDIQDNGGDDYTVVGSPNPNGEQFTFATSIAIGSSYAVTVHSQNPGSQNCPVTNGSGVASAGAADSPPGVTNIVIACGANEYNLSATVSGLAPGESLTLSDANYMTDNQTLSISANGPQNFNLLYDSASMYDIIVVNQPPFETCTVPNGTGLIETAPANVTVTCVPQLYPVGVEVSGLPQGDSLTVLDNGSDSLTIASNATVNFNTELPAGSTYNVTLVPPQPSGENCSLTGSSGNVGPTTKVGVKCTAAGPNAQYNIGVTVTGLLPGQTLMLQNNGADTLTVQGSNSPVTMNFATPVGGSTENYAISILTQPSGEGCSVGEGSGTVSTSDVTIAVTCSTQISGIEVMPANPSDPVGTSQQFQALGLFTEGGTEDLTSQATWSSSDTGIAPISPAGLATIIAPGTTTIQAQVTVGGQTYPAQTLLTGTGSGVTLSSINVSPANATISVPGTLQYRAMGMFSNGNSVDVSPWVTWSALPAGPASITATGLATGIAAGSPTVSASLQPEGQALVSGSTGLTVSAGPAASCPAGPYTNPTYCGTVSATDSYANNYSGTFYFILLPGGPVGVADQIATCSVTIAATSSPTNFLTAANFCSGQVDLAGNLYMTVSGPSFDVTFTGTVVNTTTSGMLDLPNAPGGGSGAGTFAGTEQ